jgi:hypothetical protein
MKSEEIVCPLCSSDDLTMFDANKITCLNCGKEWDV